MKALKKLAIAVMALMVLASCNKNKWVETDYSNDIVGTWTCVEAGFAEALIINSDGSFMSTGIDGANYWENAKGIYEVVNNKIAMTFDNELEFEGRVDLIPGETLSLLDLNTDKRRIYHYCAEDLSEEIVGMWVCTGTNIEGAEEMAIQTYKEDGTVLFTGGYAPEENGYIVNAESSYKIVGDMMIHGNDGKYLAFRVSYVANGTELGDIMTSYNPVFDATTSWLRIKESLDLSGKKYDYSDLYVSNVSGLDMDIEFMGYIMNFANMDGSKLDMMLKSILFNIEFPDANTISYSYYFNNNVETYNAPIEVEGNKMTIKMSENVPTFKDVEFYAFQDIDACQMHIYMHRDSFVNFYTNMQATLMTMEDEQFDITDEAAINAIYNSISDAVTSINLSLIFKN